MITTILAAALAFSPVQIDTINTNALDLQTHQVGKGKVRIEYKHAGEGKGKVRIDYKRMGEGKGKVRI